MEFKYFKMSEFACSHCGEVHMDENFVKKLDEAREIAGTPFKINSGYRCAEHNKAVGGKPNSAHLRGLAVDIQCVDSRARWLILGALFQVGITRVGIADNFIHCDADTSLPSEVVWLY